MLPLHLQPESHVPLYVQVRDQIRALVHSGALRAGDRIPASRELAAHLGVHRTTVANAYADLESEGLIRGHVGRGTFVLGNGKVLRITPPPPAPLNGAPVRWETLFADERGEESLSRLTQELPRNVISFLGGRPDAELFPLEEFRRCSAEVLRREAREILQIGCSDGYAPLKRALLPLLADSGIQAKEEQVLITSGCQQSLDLLCKAFLRPGDSVLLENPSYPGSVAIFAGARVHCLGVPVQTDARRQGFAGLDMEALETALVQNRVKLIVLTPDFHNPTGTTLPLTARRRVLEVAAKHQVPLVEDHIYARLRFGKTGVPSLKSLDRNGIVIHLDSVSKVAFPGLRVGWVVAPAGVIERLRLVKQATDLHTDQLAQACVAEFIRRGHLAKHIERARATYRARLQALQEALMKHMPSGTSWTQPEGGMCEWVTVPPGVDASELLIHVQERGVTFAPGRYFYHQNPLPNTLRLGFAALPEKLIHRGIGIFAEVLRSELRKKERGVRHSFAGRVALV